MAKLQQKSNLQKKQWTKFLSDHISYCLIAKNPESDLLKSYWNTTHCTEVLKYSNEKIVSTYCKNRWCITCNRIRTGTLINSYEPQLKSLFQPYFVTLTRPTVKGDDLPKQIELMEKNWRKITQDTRNKKFLKQHQNFIGIRKAECTVRPNDHYHYHFHLIIENWAVAEWLVAKWLKLNPDADAAAQDIRIADDGSMKELFKYFTKLTTKEQKTTDYERLNLIFTALKGKRTFQTFGGLKAISEDLEDELMSQEIDLGTETKIYKWNLDDWFNIIEGEALVGIPIPEKVKNLRK